MKRSIVTAASVARDEAARFSARSLLRSRLRTSFINLITVCSDEFGSASLESVHLIDPRECLNTSVERRGILPSKCTLNCVSPAGFTGSPMMPTVPAWVNPMFMCLEWDHRTI
jgi:hypothetical protein